MTDEPSTDEPSGPILSPAEARKRFFAYFLLKLAGLAALFGGVFQSRGGIGIIGVLLLAAGAATLFIRPKTLGLTTRPEK